MIMQAEISNTRGEDSSRGDVTPITFLPSSFRSPPVGPQVYIYIYIIYIQISNIDTYIYMYVCMSQGHLS